MEGGFFNAISGKTLRSITCLWNSELFSVNAKDRRNNWLSDDIRVEECLAFSLCNDFEDVFLCKTIGLALVPVCTLMKFTLNSGFKSDSMRIKQDLDTRGCCFCNRSCVNKRIHVIRGKCGFWIPQGQTLLLLFIHHLSF